MTVKHKCNSCGKEFVLVNGETLNEAQVENFVFITYVFCPHCKAPEVVQVDNEETKEIMRKILAKVREINMRGCKTKRQSVQLRELNRRLDKKRKSLLEGYKSKLNSGLSCLHKSLENMEE